MDVRRKSGEAVGIPDVSSFRLQFGRVDHRRNLLPKDGTETGFPWDLKEIQGAQFTHTFPG